MNRESSIIRTDKTDMYDRAKEVHQVSEDAVKIVFEQENVAMQVVAAVVFVGAIVLGILGGQDAE